jgi:hypothetical protein
MQGDCMNLSILTPQVFFASKNVAATGFEYAIKATRQAVESMQTEGEMLVQLIEQAGGVGQNINISA